MGPRGQGRGCVQDWVERKAHMFSVTATYLHSIIITISKLNRCGCVSAKSGLACPSMETYMKLHVSKNHNSLGLDVIQSPFMHDVFQPIPGFTGMLG